MVLFRYYLTAHNKFDYLSAYKFGVENSQPLKIIYSDNITKQPIFNLELDSSSLVLTILKTLPDKNSFMARLFNPTYKKNHLIDIKIKEMTDPKVFLNTGDELEKKTNSK